MSGKVRATTGILRRLLRAHGIERFALFLVQQEGKALPGGVESLSGFVLTPSGEVYGFFLDWDQEAGQHVLAPWYRVVDTTQFADDPEYWRARQRLACLGSAPAAGRERVGEKGQKAKA